jgi:Response regulator with putative antiterminator output domain
LEYSKFIILGQDKKGLSVIKNALASSGHIFVGYSADPSNILRYVRSIRPDLLIMELCDNFKDLKPVIEVMDEELLGACILLMDSRDDSVFEFLRNTRVATYLAKPVFEEVLLQIVDLALGNLVRIREYELKLKKLNNTLENRKVIEKAKWILVEQDGYTEDDAYEIIKKKSRDNRIAMREIADAIILARGKDTT